MPPLFILASLLWIPPQSPTASANFERDLSECLAIKSDTLDRMTRAEPWKLPEELVQPASQSESGVQAMSRLFLAGADAIPFLCAHLKDPRPTQLVVVPTLHILAEVSAFYDEYGFHQSLKQLEKLEEMGSLPKPFRVPCGDLCFWLLGEITNRRFSPNQQMAQIARISAPSLFPQLADRASREWGHCSKETLYRSLARDLESPDMMYRDSGALKRLLALYPGRAVDCLLVRISEPLVSGILEADVEDRLRHRNTLDPYQLQILLKEMESVPDARLDAAAVRLLAKIQRSPKLMDAAEDDLISMLKRRAAASTSKKQD